MEYVEVWKLAARRWSALSKLEQERFEDSLPYSQKAWARYERSFQSQPTSIRQAFLADLQPEITGEVYGT